MSVAAGVHAIPTGQDGPLRIQNIDLTAAGGEAGSPLIGGNGTPSHSYMWILPLAGSVWDAFSRLSSALREAAQ